MTYQNIKGYAELNEIDSDHLNELVASLLTNGWSGLPILVFGGGLLTGSHRLAALRKIEAMYMAGEIDSADVLDADLAEDVSDIVNANYAARAEDYGYDPDIDYADIGWLLTGSWLEDHKSEINEW